MHSTWRGSLPAAAMLMALVHVAACQRSEPTGPVQTPPARVAPSPASPSTHAEAPMAVPAPAAADLPNVTAADRAPTVDLSVPHTVALAGTPGLSFTIAEATIEPRSPESVRLILLVRMHNKQPEAAGFADENFRLLTKESVIHANGGLGETIDANSDSMPEQVQFVVPLGSAPRALQIEYGGQTIEVPLAFK